MPSTNKPQDWKELNFRDTLEALLNNAEGKLPQEVLEQIIKRTKKFCKNLYGSIEPQLEYWDASIDELRLPMRVYNSLKIAGIEKISDLLRKSEKDIKEIKGFKYGSKGINEIKQSLFKYCLSLRDEYE